jgi:hypothetical protein
LFSGEVEVWGKTALLGPLAFEVGKRGVLFQEEVTNLSLERTHSFL